MSRLVVVALFLACLAPMAQADQPLWAFDGLLPIIFQMHTPIPAASYTEEGRALTDEEIESCLDIRPGDRCVLIRDGAVLGECTIGEIMIKKNAEAQSGNIMYLRVANLPEGVTVADEPQGPDVLLDAGYDLFVITDNVVEMLAPDPAFQDVTWGVQDYVVRVGRLRFPVLREKWRNGNGFRGWHVEKIQEKGPVKVHGDYTWQPK